MHQDGGQSIGRRIAPKSALAGEHFVKQRAQRKEVGAMVNSLSPHLLRRHVAHSSHDYSWHRDGTLGDGGVGRSKLFWTMQFRQPEVENLD